MAKKFENKPLNRNDHKKIDLGAKAAKIVGGIATGIVAAVGVAATIAKALKEK